MRGLVLRQYTRARSVVVRSKTVSTQRPPATRYLLRLLTTSPYSGLPVIHDDAHSLVMPLNPDVACVHDPDILMQKLKQLRVIPWTSELLPVNFNAASYAAVALQRWMDLRPSPQLAEIVDFVNLMNFFRYRGVEAATYLHRTIPSAVHASTSVMELDRLGYAIFNSPRDGWQRECALIRNRIGQILLAVPVDQFQPFVEDISHMRSADTIPLPVLIKFLQTYMHNAKTLYSIQQRWTFMTVFAQLRLLPWGGLRQLFFDSVAAFKHLSVNDMANVLASLTYINYGNLTHVDRYITHARSIFFATPTLPAAINFAYVICFYHLQGHTTFLVSCLETITKSLRLDGLKLKTPVSNVLLARLLEIKTEVLNTLPNRASLVTFWPDSIQTQINRAEHKNLLAFPNAYHARLVRSTLSATQSGDPYLFETKRVGPYWIQNVDEARRLIIEIDFATDPTTKTLRHHHLTRLKYRCVSIREWRWFSCATDRHRSDALRKHLEDHKSPIFSFSTPEQNKIRRAQQLTEALFTGLKKAP